MTENVMCDEFLSVRNLLANMAMTELWTETRKLCDRFGYNGAKIYLRAQWRALEDLEANLSKEDDDFGDVL